MNLAMIKSVEQAQTEWKLCEQEHGSILRRQIEIIKHCIDNNISIEWLSPQKRTAFLLMAQGQVLIEAFEKFGNTYLWTKVKHLPLNEQKRLAEGGRVNVYVNIDGRWESKKSDPLKLNKLEVDQVFRRDGIADEEEQRSFIDALEKKHFTAVVPSIETRVDRKKDGVWIGGELYPRSTLAKWLSDLSS